MIPLECLAIHEAGHAVAGHALGVEVASVNVVFDDEGDRRIFGRCFHSPVQDRQTKVVIQLAGLVAEAIAWERRFGGACAVEPEYLVNEAVDTGLETIVEDLSSAGRLLREWWPAVEAVADRLSVDHQLSGDDVRQIVTSKAVVRAIKAIAKQPRRHAAA